MANNHLFGLLIVAAAAIGAYKYGSMSDDEKKKLADTIKNKFDSIKKDAGETMDSAGGYMNDLKSKALALLNEHFPDMKDFFQSIFGNDGTAAPQDIQTPNAK